MPRSSLTSSQAAAYEKVKRAVPSDELVESLAAKTLLEPASIRALFKKHYDLKHKASRWAAVHRRVGDVAAHAAAQTAGNAATGSAAAVAGGNGNFLAPAIAAAASMCAI